MNLFADECVFGPTIRFLQNEGHNIVTVHDFSLAGHEEVEILAFALAQNRVLLTIDLDFAIFAIIRRSAMPVSLFCACAPQRYRRFIHCWLSFYRQRPRKS